MPQSSRVTTTQLADAIGVIDQRTVDLLTALEGMQQDARTESERVWTALGNVAGVEGVAVGMADIAELLGPLRSLIPPSTALPLKPGVSDALTGIRAALGWRRETNFSDLATDWDHPVGFIGEVYSDVPAQLEEHIS